MTTVVLCSSWDADGTELKGRLVGDISAWGECSVVALKSRNFAIPAISTTAVARDGAFRLDIDPALSQVYLALLPKGAIHPILLQALPIQLPAPDLVVPIRGPPMQRAARHATGGPAGWGLSLSLVFFLGLGVFLARQFIKPTHTDRWIPEAAPLEDGRLGLALILATGGGLLIWGVVFLDEAMDLLEYTYFQEAFAGDDPLSVALSPVVAERAHAPGYAVLLWAMTGLSQAEVWLRTPALLAGLLGCSFVFGLVLQATGNHKTAWLATVLTLMAPLSMRYARDVTPYSVVGMLAAGQTWLFYRALCSNSRRVWGLYAALGTIAFFFHYFAAFLLVGHFIALLWLWLRGGRGPQWTERLKDGLVAFLAMSFLPVLWAPQVIRALFISEQDNIVTRAVYLESTGFANYLLEHLRVLVGLPAELSWAVWPLGGLLIFAYVILLKDHPALGRVLLIPSVLLLGLLSLVYVLHLSAFGGRIYFGWRWLRPYTLAVAIPMGYLAFRSLPVIGRAVALGGVGLLVFGTLWAGGRSALVRERPAQRAAANTVMEHARDGDVLAVLPAPFYSVGWSYYLHRGAPKSIHPGPSRWDFFVRDNGHVKLFGPIRSFGIPLESVAQHVDIHRLWVGVFREAIFGQPEFDPQLADHVLAYLDQTLKQSHRWRFPYLDLILYEQLENRPWTKGGVRIAVQRLYESLRWIPVALDPHPLTEMVRGRRRLHFRFPSPVAKRPIDIAIAGAPTTATHADVQSPNVKLTYANGAWRGRLLPARTDVFDFRLERSEEAKKWPLIITLK